jgi:hypothetical protein
MADRAGVGVDVGAGIAVGVAVGVGVGFGVGLGVDVGVGVGLGIAVSERVGDGVGDRVGDGVGNGDSVDVGEGRSTIGRSVGCVSAASVDCFCGLGAGVRVDPGSDQSPTFSPLAKTVCKRV